MVIVQHHEKYQEIYGEDKIVLLTQSEHKKLHIRLRKEGLCNIPVAELHVISCKARSRTTVHKKQRNEYNRSEIAIRSRQRYTQNNIKYIEFDESIDACVVLREVLVYNTNSGHIAYRARFKANNKSNIKYIDEVVPEMDIVV